MVVPYLDIHTHLRKNEDESIRVSCLSQDEILEGKSYKFTSAGIHPWWVEDLEDLSELKQAIKNLAKENKLWAIGECGIDRAQNDKIELQRETFLWHLELAEAHKIPLVIHSVRAGSDFLQFLKEKRPKTPWIFHDFRGNETLLKDILRLHPESFFSFGISIDNSPQIRELLPIVPLSNLFFETDDQKHLDIHDIFLRASHFLDMDLDFLKSQVWLNFNKLCENKRLQ